MLRVNRKPWIRGLLWLNWGTFERPQARFQSATVHRLSPPPDREITTGLFAPSNGLHSVPHTLPTDLSAGSIQSNETGALPTHNRGMRFSFVSHLQYDL